MRTKYFRHLLLVLPLAALVLAGWGCGPKTLQERAVEKAIEKSAGGKADVDLSKNQIKINGENGAAFVAGDSISLPDNFPKDILVYPGAVIVSAMLPAPDSAWLSFSTAASASDVSKWYSDELRRAGWTLQSAAAYSGSNMQSFVKDKLAISVIINKDSQNPGARMVTITRTLASPQ